MKNEIFIAGVFQPMEFFIFVFYLGLMALILTIVYLGFAWVVDLYQLYYPEEIEMLKAKLNSPAPVWLILVFWITTFNKQKV